MRPHFLSRVALPFVAFTFAVAAGGCGSSGDGETAPPVDSGHVDSSLDSAPGDSSVDSTPVDSSVESGGDSSVDSAGDSAPVDSATDAAKDTGSSDTGLGKCSTDTDCRTFASYCKKCECLPLAKTDPDPTCAPGDHVDCFVNPCAGRSVSCDTAAGKCVLK